MNIIESYKHMLSETRKRNAHDGNPTHKSMFIPVMDIRPTTQVHDLTRSWVYM